MRFKKILDSPCGIRYIFSTLELQSSFARHLLLESEMKTGAESIAEMYSKLVDFQNNFDAEREFNHLGETIKAKLSHLKDIRTTLTRLSDGQQFDDIEFFEIKALGIISEDIRELLGRTGLRCVTLPSLDKVVEILDPERQRIMSFYVYDSYDRELAELRKTLRSNDNEYNEEHLYRAATIESKVRAKLVSELQPFAKTLKQNLQTLGEIDILLAKSKQAEQLGLTIPAISKNGNKYYGLFNPEVKSILEKENEKYQKTDIGFDENIPLLITGANMGGKTITLKTLALSQYLFQFGFSIPACQASITPVEEIHLSIGDGQDMQKGLSSFAAEMRRLNAILQAVKDGKNILALIDEPANATNPTEGTALAASFIKIMKQYRAMTVVTTHYNIDNVECKKIRVKGFEDDRMNYSLIEDNEASVPREAIRIATKLGVDREWIEMAENELSR